MSLNEILILIMRSNTEALKILPMVTTDRTLGIAQNVVYNDMPWDKKPVSLEQKLVCAQISSQCARAFGCQSLNRILLKKHRILKPWGPK